MSELINETSELSNLSSNMSTMTVGAHIEQTAKFNWKIQNASPMLRDIPAGVCVETTVEMVGVFWLVKFFPRGVESTSTNKYSSITINPLFASNDIKSTEVVTTANTFTGTVLGKFCMSVGMDGWNSVVTMDESKPFPAVVGYRVCFKEFVPLTALNDCKGGDDDFRITLSMKIC